MFCKPSKILTDWIVSSHDAADDLVRELYFAEGTVAKEERK